jgi:hypothetical protein
VHDPTTITPIADLGLLRALAIAQLLRMPTTSWRHHGIGVLQGYVCEAGAVERRIHIWDPSLILPGMADSGSIHDHRFDMTSFVLLGAIEHATYDLFDQENGQLEEYALVNARASMERVGSFHTEPTPTGRRFGAKVTIRRIVEGQRYTFEKHHFHSTTPLGRTLSIVEKRNQSGSARILGQSGTPIRHAFGNAENVTDLARISRIVAQTVEMLALDVACEAA